MIYDIEVVEKKFTQSVISIHLAILETSTLFWITRNATFPLNFIHYLILMHNCVSDSLWFFISKIDSSMPCFFS